MSEYPFKIRLRDVNENYIGLVTEYLEASFITKWNGIGAWIIKLAGNSAGVKNFLPGCGISVVLPDGSLFTGHMTSGLDEWDFESNPGDGTITFSGIEDNAILSYRTVLPTPTADYTQQTVAANYTAAGPAETVVKNLVRMNLGTGALATRRLPNLNIAPDLGLGANVSISARYDGLFDLIQRLCSPIDMGFKLTSRPGGWDFSTYQPTDVSNQVIFSRKKNNLVAYSFSQVAPTVTRAIVAGAGAGISRNIQVYDSAAGAVDPIWGWLVENFIDRRDTNLTADLLQAGTEALTAGMEQQAFSVRVVDTDDIKVGRDYGLGSKVKVIVRGVSYTDVITEIAYTTKPNELRIRPTIGGADAVYGKALDVYRAVKSISARISRLERRY